jgi:argininosuccinate lyase
MARTTFGAELEIYPQLWRWLSIGDMAHLRGLRAAGAVTNDDYVELMRGLYDMHSLEPEDLDPAVGDLFSNRAALVHTQLGDLAETLHLGRARREATTLAWHLETRERLETSIEAVKDLVAGILKVAENHSKTIMPDFTYLQHAQPTTLAHYLLAFAFPLLRDLERLTTALDNMNLSPAGGGSVNGSRIGLDREAIARDLGFHGVIRHTRDAMWAPDIAIAAMSGALSAFVTIDRLAEELQVWATSEFGYFEPADRHSRISVIMPQKKNPYGLAMIRGHARNELGRLVAVITTNMTPTGQPDNRVFAYGHAPASLKTLAAVASLVAEHLEFGSFNTKAMARSAARGYMAATDVSDWLTLVHGMKNRDAHALVGRAVRLAIERRAKSLASEDLKAAAAHLGIPLPQFTTEDFDAICDPHDIIESRQGTGSVSDVPGMIQELVMRLASVSTDRFGGFEARYLEGVAQELDQRSAP